MSSRGLAGGRRQDALRLRARQADQPRQIREVEQRVNAEVLENRPTRAQVMPIERAEKSGAMMLFGEMYGDEVRVLEIGARANSAAARTSRAPATSACSSSIRKAVVAGIRRVEATTGPTRSPSSTVSCRNSRKWRGNCARSPAPGWWRRRSKASGGEKALEKELAEPFEARHGPGHRPGLTGRGRERLESAGGSWTARTRRGCATPWTS